MPAGPGPAASSALARAAAAAQGAGPVLASQGTLTCWGAAAGSRPPAAAAQGARPAGAAGPPPPRWPAASAPPGASARPALWLQFLRKGDRGLGGGEGRGPQVCPTGPSKPPWKWGGGGGGLRAILRPRHSADDRAGGGAGAAGAEASGAWGPGTHGRWARHPPPPAGRLLRMHTESPWEEGTARIPHTDLVRGDRTGAGGWASEKASLHMATGKGRGQGRGGKMRLWPVPCRRGSGRARTGHRPAL